MLIDINGDLGSGKTLFITYLAYKLKDVPVYANYKLVMDNFHPLELDQLLSFKNEKCLVLIDEAYVWLESRTSMSDINKYVSYVIFQSRKRQLDIAVTVQLNSTLDLRFKELADINIFATKAGNSGFNYYIQKGNMIKSFKLPMSVAEKLYPLYDTSEIILPPDISELQSDIENLNPEKLNKKVTEVVDLIESEFGDILAKKKKLTHDEVKDFLLRLKQPCSIEGYVYSRLNAYLLSQE